MTTTWAKAWHLLTLVVALATLLLQLVLVVQGASVLDETAVPPLGARLVRLVSYFTIQSNILVLVVTWSLARNPARDGTVWRVLRLDAVLGIAVTGVVHFFLLRPLLHLEGLNAVADTGLHLVVPVLAVLGWLVFGPRPRVDGGTVLRSLLWPVAWLLWTLTAGTATGWYPYPFLDVTVHGYGRVFLIAGLITVLFLALAAGVRLAERTLPPTPHPVAPRSPAGEHGATGERPGQP